MEKQAVDVFGDNQEKLPSPKRSRETVAHSGFSFIYLMRTIALGVALFSIVFIVFCFGTAFSAADSETPDETIATASPAETTTDAPPEDSSAVTQPSEMEGAETLPPSYDIYAYNTELVPSGETPIIPRDMSLLSFGRNYIYNETTHAPDIEKLTTADTLPVFSAIGGDAAQMQPLVLVIHTHGTEAYSPEGSISYDEKGIFARSEDIEQNVVSVGKVFCDTLNAQGIRTLHCTVMHDKESYRNSYSRAAETIQKYLAQYPTIKYVIDIHRDSLTTGGGSVIRPVTVAEGRAAAQVMCVVGSNLGGVENEEWEDNLSLALKLRRRLNDKYQNLSRPTCLRPSAYNQQYATRSLLLEIGASGNYLSEAKETARLVAEELADIIKK